MLTLAYIYESHKFEEWTGGMQPNPRLVQQTVKHHSHRFLWLVHRWGLKWDKGHTLFNKFQNNKATVNQTGVFMASYHACAKNRYGKKMVYLKTQTQYSLITKNKVVHQTQIPQGNTCGHYKGKKKKRNFKTLHSFKEIWWANTLEYTESIYLARCSKLLLGAL